MMFGRSDADKANRLLDQGATLYAKKQFGSALDAWQKALGLYQRAGNHQGEARCLSNIASVHVAKRDFFRALEVEQQALELERQVGNRKGEADSLDNLGNIHALLGDAEQAIACYAQACLHYGALGDSAGRGRTAMRIRLLGGRSSLRPGGKADRLVMEVEAELMISLTRGGGR